MGLSNEERFNKIAFSVRAIVKCARNLQSEYGDYNRLKEMAEQLWPAFLGRRGNGLFWILGGELDQNHMSDMGLISAAFQNQKVEKNTDFGGGHSNDDNDDEPHHQTYECRKTLSKMLGMSTLVDDGCVSKLIEIHQWLENLTYVMGRYDDDFARSLSDLNSVVRNMQGELFDIFCAESKVYRVWLLKNIIDKCFSVWGDDVVSEVVRLQNLHHDLRLRAEYDGHEAGDLQDTFFWLQPKKREEISTEKRLLIILALCGRRYHYEHQYNNLIELVEAHNQNNPDDLISIERVREVFDWCVEQNQLYAKNSSENHRPYCYLSHQEVY